VNHRKLPVIRILFRSYRLFFDNLPTFLRLIWFPALIGLTSDAVRYTDILIPVDYVDAVTLGLGGLYLICLIPAITSWHRLIILSPSTETPRIGFSFGKEELSYAIRVIFFYVAAFLLFMLLALPIGLLAKALINLGLGWEYWESVLWDILLALSLMPIAGFLLTFPAAAIGRPMKFGETGIFAKQNILRIWLLYLLALAPQPIFSLLIDYMVDWQTIESATYLIVAELLFAMLVDLFFFAITIGVLSLSYIWLVEKRNIPELD